MEYLKLPTDTPYTGNVVVVYDVKSSGDIYSYGDYNVSNSYGIPPNSGSLKEYDEICMNPDGFAIYCNITLSYGTKRSPLTDSDNGAWSVLSDGDLDTTNLVYNDSYGIIPPDMSSAIYVFLILADGRPIKFAGSIINTSYGITRQNK